MEKRKMVPADPYNDGDRQFLERSGVNIQIKEILTKIIENRPEDPIHFLADYFETLGEKGDRVAKAQQQLLLTHYSRPAFHNNVRAAYEILSQVKGKLKGINGVSYMEFINVLCKDMQPSIRDKLFKKIQCRDHELVVFDVFRSAIFTCLVLKDYIKQCDGLFKSLDTAKTGKVDKVLCDTIVSQLHTAVTTVSQNPSSVLEAGYMLGPDRTYSVLASAMFKNSTSKGAMNSEEFVMAAADSFLLKVNQLK